MSKLKINVVLGHQGRFEALFDGRVQAEGLELNASVTPFNDLFRIVPQEDRFDVAELSVTGFLWGLQKARDWIALPIFPGWAFAAHADTVCHVGSDIESPQDLKGKRIGVPEYPVAAFIWIRDALESQYGVRPQDMQWFEERQVEQSHYRLMDYAAPADVSVEILPKEKRLTDMLMAGELDAVMRYLGTGKRGQMSLSELGAHPSVKWLYADRKAEAMAHCKRQGFFEPIHCVIIKKSIADKYPWVPMSLYKAFAEALRLSKDKNYVVPASYELSMAEQIEVAGADFSPLGIRSNRRAVDRMLFLAHRQGFTAGKEPLPLSRVFEASTLGT
ncbi:MAG: hypothetical protein ACKVQK_18505 [Burkholderiales bacterium]